MQQLIVLAFAVATISVTITESRLFKGFREWIASHWAWGGELVSCPYCFGHWVALPVTLYYRPAGSAPIDLAITWLAMTGMAAVISGTIGRLHG